MPEKFDYIVWCDGGSRGNGTPDAIGWGSFIIRIPATGRGSKQIFLTEQEGETSNQAELRALFSSLMNIHRVVHKAGKDPKDFTVEAHTDSRYVYHQIGTRAHKTKMNKELVSLVRDAADSFKHVEIMLEPRRNVEKVLGH